MAIDVKATLRKALSQLQKQRDEINTQIRGIENLLGQGSRTARRRRRERVTGAQTRRRLTAAQKRAISKRMKAYWAKKGAAKSK